MMNFNDFEVTAEHLTIKRVNAEHLYVTSKGENNTPLTISPYIRPSYKGFKFICRN